jgi:hypothetical protein
MSLAPPSTVVYNNDGATYTEYELRNSNDIAGTELAIAKAMLTRNIANFNSTAPNNDNTTKNVDYQNTIGSGANTHLMFNHQQTDLGTIFAFGSQHVSNDGATGMAISENHTTHLSFNIPHGKLGASTQDYEQNQVTIDDNSASYYDSQLAFITVADNSSGSTGASDHSITVNWNGSSKPGQNNVNAERAVNSIYSTWGSGIAGAQDFGGVATGATGNQDHPYQYSESIDYNRDYSIYTEKLLTRNATTKQITGSATDVTDAISTLTNSSNINYYSEKVGIHPNILSGVGVTGIGRNTPGLTGINPLDIDMSKIYGQTGNYTHEAMFFGSIKAVQDNEKNSVSVAGNMVPQATYNAAGTTGFSFTMLPQGIVSGPGVAPFDKTFDTNGDILPTTFTESKLLGKPGVTGLFDSTDKQYVFHNYELGITGLPGGGYTFSAADVANGATGVTIDDNFLVRNVKYMANCPKIVGTNGFTGHSVLINNGSFTKTTANSVSATNDFVTVDYTAETLSAGGWTGDYIVDLYETTPNLTPPNLTPGYLTTGYLPRVSAYGVTGRGPYTTVGATGLFGFTGTTYSPNYTDAYVQFETAESLDGTTTYNGTSYPMNTSLGVTGRVKAMCEYEVGCLFPNTGLGKTGNWNSDNFIASNNGANLIIRHNGFGANSVSDYTFNVTNAGVTGMAGLAGTNFTRITLENTLQMAQENTMYTNENLTTGVTGTSVTAVGENIVLKSNATVNHLNATDLRLVMEPKTTLSASSFTNGWSFGPASGALITDLNTKDSFFGSNIYTFLSNKNNTATINLSLNTNTSVPNRDTLSLNATASCTYNSVTNSVTIPENSITLDTTGITSAITDTSVSLSKWSGSGLKTGLYTVDSVNTYVNNLLLNYVLKENTRVHKFKPKFLLNVGPYSNLQVTGNVITMTTKYYTLEHSSTGVKLSDNYLQYYKLYTTDSTFIPIGTSGVTRTLSNNNADVLTLSAKDLYGFNIKVQRINSTDTTSTWSDVSGAISDFDPAYNTPTSLILYNSNNVPCGTINVTADITSIVDGSSAVLYQPTYYVGLTTAPGNLTYIVLAKTYDTTDTSNGDYITTWTIGNDLRTPTFSAGGTNINNLTATISFTSPDPTMDTQPSVTLTVSDGSGNIWFTITTSNDNMTSNFTVYYCARPYFKIRKVIGSDFAADRYFGSQTVTYYKMADRIDTINGNGYLEVDAGVRLKFNHSLAQKDQIRLQLRGDRIHARPYRGYAGSFNTLTATSVPEVTLASGLVIGDNNCIKMNLQGYRGNSVKLSGNMTQTNSPAYSIETTNLTTNQTTTTAAFYERFQWLRTLSTICLELNNNGNIYRSAPTYMHNGAIHTVNDLVRTTDSSDTIGGIGLKFNEIYSRYPGQSSGEIRLPITVTGASYEWSIKNPNRRDQYSTIVEDENEEVNVTSSTLKTQTEINNLPGSYLVKNGSGIKNAVDYILFNFVSNDFVAGKVKITSREAYSFKYTLPTLDLYYSSSYVGQPNTFTYKNTPFQRISYNALRSANKVHIEVPAFYFKEYIRNDTTGTVTINGIKYDVIFYGGEVSSGKKSIYVINRTDTTIESHTGYFVLPRPQYKVEVVSTKAVEALPYNLSNVTKLTRYVDILSSMDEQTWNTGTRSERGYGTFAAYYTYNWLTNSVSYYNKNPYMALSSAFSNTDGVNLSTVYTGVNYLRTKINRNSEPSRIIVDSNTVKIDLLLGYSNLDNTINDDTTGVYNYSSTANDKGVNYHTGTYKNKVVRVYDGPIHRLLTTSSYFDANVNKTTYLNGFMSGNGKYGIQFNQDSSIFSTEITTISGGLGNVNYNIKVNGLMPFMSLDSTKFYDDANPITIDPFSIRHLDLLPGDATKLVLYGHTYEMSNNDLVAKLVKYETATGIDFSAISGSNILMKNIVFTAAKKYTSTVTVRSNTNVLGNTPFNLLNDAYTAANDLLSLPSWSDPVIASTPLSFTTTALSKKGQGILTDILGASALSPYRVLVCNFPPRVAYYSPDGSPLHYVNSFGTLYNQRLQTQVVELINSDITGSNSFPSEYMAYNTLRSNAL